MPMKLASAALLLASALVVPLAHAQAPFPTIAAPDTTQATPSPDLAEFQLIEDKWADALANKDQYALELILSPHFVGISSGAVVTNRNQQIALIYAKGKQQQTIEPKVVSVRVLADAAIVNGTYVIHSSKDSKDTNAEKGVFTHVFQRSRSGWLCVNAQNTAIINPALSKGQQNKK